MTVLSIIIILIEILQPNNAISVERIPSFHFPCIDDDNCNFGMMCTKNHSCVCSRLYDWSEELKECKLNIQEVGLWLSSLKEETDIKGVLDAEANEIFFHLSMAGALAILIGFTGGLLCVYFFCIQKPLAHITNLNKIMRIKGESLSSIDVNDIESRIMFLKRRAAEADFLREERDFLISRLKLYNPDYIWPESGINKSLNLPAKEELDILQNKNNELRNENEVLAANNDDLESQNNNLIMKINDIEPEVNYLKNILNDFDSLTQENRNLQEMLKDHNILKAEKERLSIEKNQCAEEMEKLLEVFGSNDPVSGCKTTITKLHNQIEMLSKDKMELLNSLFSKEIQIDTLKGKISHLQSKLEDPFTVVKIKLSLGKELSDKEAYMWAIHNLELTNKKMNCEVEKITQQLDIVTDKYKAMQDNLKLLKVEGKSHVNEFDKTGGVHFSRFNFVIDDTHTGFEERYARSEAGSTAPVSREVSSERNEIYYVITEESAINKLRILEQDAIEMKKVHNKLRNMKGLVEYRESLRKTVDRFFSFNPNDVSKIYGRNSVV